VPLTSTFQFELYQILPMLICHAPNITY